MRNLIRHIENLLSEHDCVIVPGWGGFVQNERPAYYDEETQCSYPAGKQIGFNAQLTFNDGLLAQSYQQDSQLDYEQAMIQIRQCVNELHSLVNQGKCLTLGQIGRFYKNKEGLLVFKPQENNTLHPASFGLKALPISTLDKNRMAASVSKEARVVALTKKSEGNMGKWVVAVAACLLFMLLFSPKTAIDQESSNYLKNEASMMPPCSLSTPTTLVPEQLIASSDLAAVSEKPNSDLAVALAVDDENDFAQAKKQSYRQYLIVIASFPTQQEAEQYIRSKHLKQKFPEIGITTGGERSRVYVNLFQDKEQALFFLSEFRKSNSQYAKSWVLSL